MAPDGDANRDRHGRLPATAPYIDGETSGRGAPGAETEVLIGEVLDSEYPDFGAELVLARRPPRDGHPVVVYLASLSEGSRRAMRASLENIARLLSNGEVDAFGLAWPELRYGHTAFVRSRLSAAYAPATANKMLSALRGVLKECFRLGYMTAEDHARARDLAPVKGSSLPPGRSLSHGEVRRLFEICSEDNKRRRGARDAALVAVLYGCGLRRGEAAALEISDYDPETAELRVRGGKGRRDRITYASEGAADALGAWIAVRGDEEGPLFCPINKGDRIVGRAMTDQAIYNILRRLGAEIKTRSFSPHDMRRTFIGDLLDAGADLSAAQQLAGHANVQTTAKYDRRGERAKKKAASLLHVPYCTEE
ncbi:MAG: site-specific integrase [Actinomycetota bacterium]|nr:site-specific integrase [Actinomycetota bacterium]